MSAAQDRPGDACSIGDWFVLQIREGGARAGICVGDLRSGLRVGGLNYSDVPEAAKFGFQHWLRTAEKVIGGVRLTPFEHVLPHVKEIWRLPWVGPSLNEVQADLPFPGHRLTDLVSGEECDFWGPVLMRSKDASWILAWELSEQSVDDRTDLTRQYGRFQE